MPKPEQIQSDELRPLLVAAHTSLRGGDPAAAVHRCADAFLKLAAVHPRVLQIPEGMRIHPWPRLGAFLVQEEGQPPRIDFQKERFTLSEAITYYEYTLNTILGAERRAAEAAASS